MADRIRADYIEWRRGEAGKKEREKEKRRKKAGADTMKNLSVFHSRLPGQYLGKARSSTSAVT